MVIATAYHSIPSDFEFEPARLEETLDLGYGVVDARNLGRTGRRGGHCGELVGMRVDGGVEYSNCRRVWGGFGMGGGPASIVCHN